MNRVFGFHCLIPSLALSSPHRGELFDPSFVAIEFGSTASRDRLAQELAAIRHDTEIDAAAAADLFWFNIHLDHTCIGWDNTVAPAGSQTNAGAEQDNK